MEAAAALGSGARGARLYPSIFCRGAGNNGQCVCVCVWGGGGGSSRKHYNLHQKIFILFLLIHQISISSVMYFNTVLFCHSLLRGCQ